MARTAKEIADMIDRLQQYYVASSLTPVLLNDDEVLQMLRRKGLDLGATTRLGRKDNSYYEGLKLWDSLSDIKGNPGFTLDFLGSQLMTMLSWVGHELSLNDYFDKTPELEFLRHLRNGISHGNAFHLRNGEPKRSAKFRTFAITSALDGRPVLFEFMHPGDLFDLFDEVKRHLRTLP